MPYRTLSLAEAAQYLHLARTEVELLVKSRDIPFERHGKKVIFRKVEIDAWASPRILGLEPERLADYHEASSHDTRLFVPAAAMIPGLIRTEFIEPALPARTKASVLYEMAELAGRSGRLWDLPGLVEGMKARENLCSTGLPGGLALLHTRNPDANVVESAFIVLGRTVQPIPFGAPDGRPTDLFFLLACPDDRLHLHTLARLCLMAQKTDLLSQLRAAADAEAMHQALVTAEAAVVRA